MRNIMYAMGYSNIIEYRDKQPLAAIPVTCWVLSGFCHTKPVLRTMNQYIYTIGFTGFIGNS